MILYSKSKERVEIFNKVKNNNIPELAKFEAIDTINNWNYWCNYSIKNNFATKKYITKIGGIYGKLGCNLSHQMLIQYVYNNLNNIEWLMIMEDDIKLDAYSNDLVNNIVDEANKQTSHYVQLFVNKNHKIYQSRATLVNENLKLYQMTPQWGTVCYLIDRVGMKAVIDGFPIDTNMDLFFNSMISQLKSLCYLGNTFDTCGTMDSQDNSAPLGSLIWKKDVIKKSVETKLSDNEQDMYVVYVKFHNDPNNTYLFPAYLYQFLNKTFDSNQFIITKLSTKDDYNKLGNNISKCNNTINNAYFIIMNPYLYMLFNFIETIANDKLCGNLRYIVSNTQQLHLGKWMDENKLQIQSSYIKFNNKVIYKNITLDELVYKINNNNSITNLSLIKYYLKKVDSRCPNIEDLHNHNIIREYIENRFSNDFTVFGYDKKTLELKSTKIVNESLEMVKYIDDDPNNHIYQSLWIGDELSNMEKLSIKSFIDNGHIYHLYTYGEVRGIPEGAIVKDGNDIIDKNEIFTYKNGSHSAFSNLFRFTLLYKKGGYWIDTDFVCIKPMYFDMKYAIATEPNENYTEQLVTSCLLKLPKGSKEAEEGIRIQKEHKTRILSGDITWSSGPQSVKDIVNKYDLHKFVIDWRQICSCFCHHSKSLIDTNYVVENKINGKQIRGIGNVNKLDNMLGIHLWHECWRRDGMDKNGKYSNTSIYGSLCKLFLNDTIAKIKSKVKVIFVVSRKTYLTKMSRVRFHSINALMKLKNIELIYTGIGWDNYNIDYNIHQNLETIKNLYNWNTIDYVLGYKPLDIPGYSNIKYTKIIRYNEMYDIEWTLKEIKESGSDIVICHHLNDYQKYDTMKLVKQDNITPVKIYYIGHCVESSIYKDWGHRNDKLYDLMLVGCLGNHYPLRNRFKELLPIFQKKGYRIHIHPHPGYDLNDAHTDKYQIEFAQALNKTKIALTDTGLPKSRFGKYIEIPACATVLAGDTPSDEDYNGYNADKFEEFIININVNTPDDKIIEKIEYYLQRDGDGYDSYVKKLENGIEFANKYRQDDYCDKMYKILCDNKN